MAASTHSQDRRARRRAPSTSRADDPAETLVSDGLRLLFGAPELALVFGERAAALAEASGSERVWAYAEGLSVTARVRLGYRADVVNRAVVVLRTAEADGHADLAAQMRTELALCARSVGVPLTGLAALRPVLADEHAQPVCRVGALLQFVGCMASIGRRGVLDRALEEADKLAGSDPSIGDADRVSLSSLVQARTAAHLRRHGDISASIDAARKGLDLIDSSGDVLVDSTQLRARLTLELVCALLDQGAREDAAALAHPLFAEQARAAAIAPLAWMRLAIATRVHLASAATETAGMLIRDALHHTRRHELLSLSSRLLLELSHIEERLGRSAEALACLREARVHEHSYGRLRRQALGLLTGEFGRGEQPAADFNRALAEHEERVAEQRRSRPAGGKRRRVEPSTEATQMMPAITDEPPAPRSAPAAQPTPSAPTAASAWETVEQPAVPWTAAEYAVPDHSVSDAPPPWSPDAPPSWSLDPTPSWSPDAAPSWSPEPAPWSPEPAVAEPASWESASWLSEESAPGAHAASAGGDRHAESADTGSRHHAEDTPSARSVLERLGVSIGSGGKRRASDDEPERHGKHEQHEESWQQDPPQRMPWDQPDQPDRPAYSAQSEPPNEAARPDWAVPAHAEWSWRPEPEPQPQSELQPQPEPAPEPEPEYRHQPSHAAHDAGDAEPATSHADKHVVDEHVDEGTGTTTDAETEPDPAPVRELDSVLAVFSSWANGDDDNSTVAPRVRSRRWQRTGTSESATRHRAANGHAVNGDGPLRGTHGGGLS